MILEKIREDLQKALKNKETEIVSVLRLLLAAITNKEIELNKRGQLTDEEILAVISKQAKQRHESIEAYQKGARSDLADKEKRELAILNKYLPQKLSPSELKKIIKEIIKETGAASSQDLGKVMGKVMGKTKGRAEGKMVAEMVKKELG